ncbi:MAG: hypothetical protein RJA09_1434 [Pseudomonadota bacterium]
MNPTITTPPTATPQGSSASRPSAAPSPTAKGRLVTDAPTRVFHGLFALCFIGAYLTADGEKWRLLHVVLGYSMAGLLLFRVLYGIWGPKPSHLSSLWRKVAPSRTWLQGCFRLRSWDAVSAHWRQGQNLLMGVAVITLLVGVVPLVLSGYATYNDWGDVWGGEWLEETHEWLGEAFLWVVLAHVALVLAISLWRRKNHATLMWSGRVPGSGPDLVRHNRVWLAVLLLAAVLAYVAWEWQASPQGLVPWRVLTTPAAWVEDGDDD